MLFLYGFRRHHRAKSGVEGAVGRLVFAVSVLFVVCLAGLAVHIELSTAPVDSGRVYYTDGSTPIAVHGLRQNTSCRVDAGRPFAAPQRDGAAELFGPRGYHIPADGVARDIVCTDDAEISESRLVPLSLWLLDFWILLTASLIGGVGFVAGWSTFLVPRRPVIRG